MEMNQKEIVDLKWWGNNSNGPHLTHSVGALRPNLKRFIFHSL